MSWVHKNELSWYERFVINLTKFGPIPKHVAFIMDGNRRYAKKLQLKSQNDGHVHGFQKLAEVLHWCLEIGIKEVTVFAFSIENFKRSADEVDKLLTLAREKFHKLLSEKDQLNERGICIRVIGNLQLLPIDLQTLIAQAMLLTKNNCKTILNVAFAYTSRDEITNSMLTLINGVYCDRLQPNDINEKLLRKCIYSKNSPDPDLLVRTSGEARLSDFYLWQCSSTLVYFTKYLWPEFSLWHLIGAVLYYQMHYNSIMEIKESMMSNESTEDDYDENSTSSNNNSASNKRIKNFLEIFEKDQLDRLHKLSEITIDTTDHQDNTTNKCPIVIPNGK